MSYFLRFVSFTLRQLGIRLHSDVQSFVCLLFEPFSLLKLCLERAMKESSKYGPNFYVKSLFKDDLMFSNLRTW